MCIRHRVSRILHFSGQCQSTYTRTLHSSSTQLARHRLDKIPQPHFHPFDNPLHQNHDFKAIDAFKTQQRLGQTHELTVARTLKGCCRGYPKLGLGCQIHAYVIASGLDSFVTVCNSLMNMYFKNGDFDLGLYVFEKMAWRDTVSWNTVISGTETSVGALSLAVRMNKIGVGCNAVTCTSVLSRCLGTEEEFMFGLQTHCCAVKHGFDLDVVVGNALISFYFKWGCFEDGKRVFDGMTNRDLVSWNAVISGYAQDEGHESEAIGSFLEMAREGMELDHVSFASAVSACLRVNLYDAGKQIHGMALKRGYGTHTSVGNLLISLYWKCNFVEDSNLVFEKMAERNVVSWTTRITIDEEVAVTLFKDMLIDGVYPNDVTFVSLLHSITKRNMVKEGLMVHGYCKKTGFLSALTVSNSFVTMYAKFETMAESMKVFDEISYREIETWNALISGYAQNGRPEESVEAFYSAIKESNPTQFTFGSVLNAIGDAEAISLRHGQVCHSYLIKVGFNTDLIVSNALLDMYARRENISESRKVFNEMCQRSQVSYSSIISAYASHGDLESVMALFNEMETEGIRPDSVTFLSILTACGRLGTVDLGHQIYNMMVQDYGIKPSPEHYSCMVDMLGWAGRLTEAEMFVAQIPGGPRLSVLLSLLGSCRTYKNVDMGKKVADLLNGMDPTHSGSHVLISNLYAENGEWDKVAKVRRKMRQQGVRKEIGFSWVDVGNIETSFHLHGFSSSDMTHPQSKEIYKMADCLDFEIKLLELKKGSFVSANTVGIEL